ncbi:cell envelope integrity protein CreD [Mucilaginibacter mali]|uniref:Cell envelope integrity protein CreD n=1 Tax=Mucilaginibacter mali TaxID=2740462 RepID=A0A7D4QCJ3_9SPHI|nr:cell envelope integrity protein CreD [Mucilaginibacter mali]QKJ32345.1 cell envelope integrity protein CreD [Mucilaginibacter mali]
MIGPIEKQSKWYEGSAIMIKSGVIAVMILALLIPSAWIQDLVTEREGYQQGMVKQVSNEWAGDQTIQGPVLAIPYKLSIEETDANKKTTTHDEINMLYVLPQNLKIKADVKGKSMSRGVYDAIVYNSKIDLQGDFPVPDLKALGIDEATVLYDKARLVFGVTDMNGLKNTPVIKIAGQDYTTEPAATGHNPFANGLQARFALQKGQGFAFSYQLDLRGSNNLQFLHTGKTTDVEVNSDWAHPNFDNRTPDNSNITDKGFTANWRMSYFKRPFPQQWAGDDSVLAAGKSRAQATFGVRLQLPIDQYRKVMRTTKYSTLVILLTFVSLFLTELIRKKRIHLFNYALIGAAMIVYYTLLLSFSEQLGFNWSYLISSAATIALIAWFTGSLLKNGSAAALFAGILTVFYGFIYVLVQLEELSLMVGSLALFIVVAALMYFSRRINFEQH